MDRKSISAYGTSVRRAFTLVELIVVVGIIGILAGIIITSFSGGMESARAAQCLSNMRNLAQGATAYVADRGGDDAYFPYAGCYVTRDGGSVNPGWIRWLDMGGNGAKGKRVAKDNINACCKDDDKAIYAITNGTLWKYVNRDMKTYVCPEHKVRAEKYGAKPRFSYVMNAWFRYDKSLGDPAQGYVYSTGRTWQNDIVSGERTLLFAELPFGIAGSSFDKANARFCPYTNDKKKQSDGEKKLFEQMDGQGNTLFDCTLQYKARYNNRGYHDGGWEDWGGQPEAIAFNHRNGKKRCAHVVFCDGHTEKLALVEEGKSSRLDAYQLTALLCEGVAVTFSGSDGYSMPEGADK